MLESVLASVLNRFLASYVDGLNTSQLNVGIWSGDVKLRNLRLKTSALDKFRLPIDVKEGYLGDLTLSIPWSNLKGKPVRVLVENVYLLAAPKNSSAEVDEDEEEERAQAAKQEKLANAELLGRDGPQQVGISSEDAQKNESFTSSLVTKIIDNLQITVRNIHIRYEDDLSNPEHPFSAGITLAEFSAVSTDSDWNPTFIQNSSKGIHKLAKLESLALYWDTDAESLAGYPIDQAQRRFKSLIAREGQVPSHQFILSPVSGAGRLVMRSKMTPQIAKMDAELLFDQLGFKLDDEQYRDVISVTDLFHFFTRQAQYRRFRPAIEEMERNRPRAMLHFAGRAILNEVHEKHKVWSWNYFRQRRDDRREYVRLFKQKEQEVNKTNQQQAAAHPTQSEEGTTLRELERRLSYKDIRFYRSIARNELSKERIKKRKEDLEHNSILGGGGGQKQQGGGGGGWLGWIWGGGGGQGNDQTNGGMLNEQQRKELYDAIEWDEESGAQALAQSVDLPGDALKLKLTARLQKGSFSLRDHSKGNDIISLVFDSLQADVSQRIENFVAAISLGGLRVYDGTLPNSLYPQIVRVKEDDLESGKQSTWSEKIEDVEKEVQQESDPENPFFSLQFENKPLDKRADNALTLRMRSLEIIYHKVYVESIVRFFKPPESELELIGALIDVASETIEGIRKETRAGLENALEHHKTIDIDLDVKAPIIIVPQDACKGDCQHIVLDAGKISLKSVLADQDALDTIKSKQSKQYTEEDYRQLEDLMYDRFFVKLEKAQLVMGPNLKHCMDSLSGESQQDHALHLLERINLDFTLHNSILPKAPNLTKFKITGHLPLLRVNFSDRKYKTLMTIIDATIPNFEEEEVSKHFKEMTTAERKEVAEVEAITTAQEGMSRSSTAAAALNLSKERRSRIASQMRGDEYIVDTMAEEEEEEEDDAGDFKDAEDVTTDKINAKQKTFELNFVVDSLQGSIYKSNTDPNKPDRLLVEANFEGFLLNLGVFPYHLEVDVGLRSLELEDKIVNQKQDVFKYLITSKSVHDGATKGGSNSASSVKSDKDLVRVKYTRVQTDSPEFMSVYEGIDQTVNVDVSTINITLTRVSILAVYDWIMTTFVPEEPPVQQKQNGHAIHDHKEGDHISVNDQAAIAPTVNNQERKEMLRVRVKLTSIVLRLNNDGQLLSTLTLSTADVAVLLRGNTMRVAARLGSLLLLDNSLRETASPEFKKLLTIDGDELADFTYETFDPEDEQTYPGYDMAVWLRTGSLRFTFLEEPIADLLQFFSKFAQMKAVYDAATEAASAQATQLQARVMKIHYDVIIKTPIVVLPRDITSADVLIANLGEIYAHNTFHNDEKTKHVITKVEAGIRHIRLASRFVMKRREHHLQMIDDVNISVDVTQQEHVDHQAGEDDGASREPDMQILAKMSDVQIKLTEQQYGFIIKLTQSIPKAFAFDYDDDDDLMEDDDSLVSGTKRPVAAMTDGSAQQQQQHQQQQHHEGISASGSAIDMLPELGTRLQKEQGETITLSTSLDLLFNIQTINIELFTASAIEQESMHQASLARFALTESEFKLKMLSDSSMEAEVTLKSFNVTDTRPIKETRFREIIPSVKHDGFQFMMSYTQAGDGSGNALALITIDSPKIIFSLDPLFSLVNFFSSAFEEVEVQTHSITPAEASRRKIESSKKSYAGSKGPSSRRPSTTKQKAIHASDSEEHTPVGTLAFRINVVDPTIILLATPEQSDTLAVVLSIRQVLMSQQGILALKVDQFGMFMCRMDRPKDTVRLVDNFDVALSSDSRADSESLGRVNTSIEINVDPIVLRVSIRDLVLISEVINKAIELSARKPSTLKGGEDKRKQASLASSTAGGIQPLYGDATSSEGGTRTTMTRGSSNHIDRLDTAELLVSRETLKADLHGFQLILIGDLHSFPLLDCNISGFHVDVQDWSADMHASTLLNLYINYYNLNRSHWEPLIDPWNVHFNMESKNGSNDVVISSQKRLELNITCTLIELSLTSYAHMAKVDLRSGSHREHQAPFKICNRTGYRLSVWSQQEDGKIARHGAQHVDDGHDIPWQFGDWKLMREHIMESSGGNQLSIHIEGMPWERIKHLGVDQEGEKVVNLRPKMDKVTHRLLCEVKVVDNVKVVTLRSTFNIENNTLVPIEFVLLDSSGQLTGSIHKIAPGQSCPVPIESAFYNQIRLRPDPGFEYGWSNEAVDWRDLIRKSTRVMTCNDANDKEAPFRFQCFTLYDRQDPNARHYPRLTLRLRAPIEVENLLPYDIQYRIFDKNFNRNWSSFLRKGGISPIHVVDLSHLLLLSIDIQSSVFSPSEFAIIATDNGDDFPVEKFLTLADDDNLKLQLRLYYHKYSDSGGAFKVQIYSPYIFINLTGLPFSLKTKSWIGGAKLVAGQEKEVNKNQNQDTEPFLFSHPSRDRRNRVQLRVGDSNWSRPTSFEAIGSETELVIPSISKNEEIHLGLTIEEGLGKFNLSKVIKLTPRYVIRNNLGEEINLREMGAADFITALPNKRQALHFLRVGASKQISLAYPGLNNKWTSAFNLEDIGRVHLRIARLGHQQHLIKVEVILEGPTIFITLDHETNSWPFMLRNESDYTITFMQAIEKGDQKKGQGGLMDEAVGKRYELKPKSKMKYAWDYPAMSDKIIKLVANGRERNVNILEIGSLLPFKFPSGDGRSNRVVALDVRADGPTQTLVLSNWTEANSNYKLKRANSTFSRTDSIRTDAGFEAIDVDTEILSSFSIECEGVGISIINRNVQELAYISFRGLEFHYTESEVTTAFNIICRWIQIDNQLFSGLFPIVLYPAVIAPNDKDLESHPTLQASLIQSKDVSHGVTHIKYASFLLQEVTVELDEDFLFAVYDFTKFTNVTKVTEDQDCDFVDNPREIPEPAQMSGGIGATSSTNSTSTQDVYIGILHLQPLAINLSIVRSEQSYNEQTTTSGNPLSFVLNAASMAVGSLADAPIRLSALVIENVRVSPQVLVERVTMHYTQGMLFQLYRLVGSIDVLGNPVSLFNTVSGGVLSLFYEPYQGLVMHGNHRELGMGLARGASTAVKSIVFGLSDSASKMTGSISQGLASATMDREFQARRRMTKFRNKPRHALLGLTAAGQSFFTSVTSGVEGLALRPLEGAEQNGAAGFVAGIGKALVGLATKPAVGLFDAASNITEGVRNTTAIFEKNEIDRIRLPRFIASDEIVRPYSDREALGQTWLKNVDEGRLMRDHYVAHVDVGNNHHASHMPHMHLQQHHKGDGNGNGQVDMKKEYQKLHLTPGDNVILLTISRILFIKTIRMKVAWEVLLCDLSSISLEKDGIALILRGNLAGPFLPLQDVASRNWLFKQISRVVQSYNAAHQQ